ncbi:DoxX family protein [Leptospira sp. 'Mane']|uniref:DoxX family protein n=1 Tax=Leptospira sp. 'Mane' TaxID=3387407 RepID=UPI00398BB668
MTTSQKIIFHSARFIAAIILGQTLYFKFTGAEESVYIFTTLGMEPWGRYASAVVELIAALLLLVPSLVWLGALISLNVISGAILSHLIFLGVEVMGDYGVLFGLACVVLIASVYLVYVERKSIPILKHYFH